MEPNEMYSRYCKPQLGFLLSAVRLDQDYHRAEGDCLYYNDTKGDEVEILDFLGGYGASLFGHNHPELISTAISTYEARIPFNAQASCRSHAAQLGAMLNGMLSPVTNRQFVSTFASTGAEAVDIAIKHAELFNQHKIKGILDGNRKKSNTVAKSGGGAYRIAPESAETIKKLGFPEDLDVCAILARVQELNQAAFSAQPLFIAIRGAFHGKTSGALSLTENSAYREPFARLGLKTAFVSSEDAAELEDAFRGAVVSYLALKIDSNCLIHIDQEQYMNVTAVFVEPLQGEGGVRMAGAGFLQQCRSLTHQFGVPLVFDEIQCGMGRTGTFLFSEQLNVTADYYLLSKSLGGGMAKISAALIDASMYIPEFSMIQSSTFAEDSHSANIAMKALELLERGDRLLMRQCAERGDQLMRGLNAVKAQYPSVIKEVRGRGLMLGVEFCCQGQHVSNALKMISAQNLLGYVVTGYLLHEHRIRIAPVMSCGTTIRLEPSAYISAEDCSRLIGAVERMCEAIYKGNMYELLKYVVGADSYGTYTELKNYRIDRQVPPIVDPDIPKVAFLGHFIEAEHAAYMDPSFGEFSADQIEEFIDRLYPIIEPLHNQEQLVYSENGEQVNLVFLGLYLTSKIITRHMKARDLDLLRGKIDRAVQLAERLGCKAMGFGGFNSILVNNCKLVSTDSVALTTGNALTAAMGLEAIYQGSAQLGIDLGDACFAAIGAAGNIASVYSEILAQKVRKVILIGSQSGASKCVRVADTIYYNALLHIAGAAANEPLTGVAQAISAAATTRKMLGTIGCMLPDVNGLHEMYHAEMGESAPVVVTADYAYLLQADLILGASNASSAVVFPEMLGSQPVVICDIAVPADVHQSVAENCPNALVIKGGLVQLPLNPDFSIAGLPLDIGHAFACMSETMLMGLEGITDHYSYGNIRKEQVAEIMGVARKHGFRIGKFKLDSSY